MSASKYASGDPSLKLGPLPARPAPAAPPAPGAAAQEKVLAEITHELGNFFHKLYYWSDFLQDRRIRPAADGTATQMLETTIRNFEHFIKLALEYFHPVQLACIRMGVADVAAALRGQLQSQLNGTPLRLVESAPWGDAVVMVDCARLSQVLEIAVRHLIQHVGPDSSLLASVDRVEGRDGTGLEIGLVLESPNSTSPLFQTPVAGLQWAVAERVVELHGGALAERELERGARAVVLYLPLAMP